MSRKRVLIVEDQVLFRKALKRVLAEVRKTWDFFEVGSARDGFQMIQSERYELVITDLCFPGEDGLWLLSKLREKGLNLPVLVVTASERPEQLNRAIELGARGYLQKDSDPSQLLLAVDRLMQGETHFPQPVSTSQARLPRLNARALEILCHSNDGVRFDEIQRKMALSDESFASLSRSICRKLQSECVKSAAQKAFALGLIAGRDHG